MILAKRWWYYAAFLFAANTPSNDVLRRVAIGSSRKVPLRVWAQRLDTFGGVKLFARRLRRNQQPSNFHGGDANSCRVLCRLHRAGHDSNFDFGMAELALTGISLVAWPTTTAIPPLITSSSFGIQ